MASLLDLDARWKALQTSGGLVDIGFEEPTAWTHGERGDQPVLKVGEDQLAADLCRFGERRFLRVTAQVPIRGSDEALGLSIWAAVSPEVFYAYLDMIDGGDNPPAANARLANDLGTLAGLGDGMELDFTEADARPTATGLDVQSTGIDLDTLFALYADVGVSIG